MATKQTTHKTKAKTAKKVVKESSNEPSFLQVVFGSFYSTLRSQKLWVSIGVTICILSILLAVSFVSNIQLGYADQANLEEGLPVAAKNSVGRMGAIISWQNASDSVPSLSPFLPSAWGSRLLEPAK